jgi:hypothetical protein
MTPRPAAYRQGVFVFIALVLYAVMALVAVSGKSNTFDEPLHITGGYTYWRLNDYRIQPENGNWPERLAGLPTAIRGARFAPPSDSAWQQAFTWKVSDQFFYGRGNDANAILMSGRAMITLVGMVLGAVIFGWASRLFGAAGGWVSLIIYVFSPTFLAHGALATSDVTAALFFVAASWSLWIALHRMTIRTILVSVFCLGGLFLSKFSAVLFVPMAMVMLAVRMIRRAPLTMGRTDSTAVPQVRVSERMLGLIAVHAIGVFFMIWASYGFRYSMLGSTPMAGGSTDAYWARLENPNVQSRFLIAGMRSAHVLPEGWLYGMQHVLSHEDDRPAFLNGTFYNGGKLLFFPYAALVKTTIPALVLLILVPVFIRMRSRSPRGAGEDDDWTYRGLYALTPVITLVVIYWLAALNTQLNIGHRHLLPALAGTAVFFGAAGDSIISLINRLRSRDGSLAAANWGWGAVVALLLTWHAAESVMIFPNYLAYFNELDGGPADGWRHLNDSSLDWGQDLSTLKGWLDDHGLQKPGHEPVYFSYFGSADPSYYHLDVERLPGPVDRLGWRAPPDLTAGVYCISATMLNAVYLPEAPGPWSPEAEGKYQEDGRALAIFATAYNNTAALHKLIVSAPEGAWAIVFKEFERLRFGRLAATLRRRDPDDEVGYSILVYRVTADELRRALDGPPPFGGATP